jgi:hypothetical protein
MATLLFQKKFGLTVILPDRVANLGSHLRDHDHAGAIMGYSLLCILQLTDRFYQKLQTGDTAAIGKVRSTVQIKL